MEPEKTPSSSNDASENDRREFLKKCGKFAAVTPPAITMLLSTSLTSNAIAKSGHGGRGPTHTPASQGPRTNPGASHGNKNGWDKNGKR